MANNINCTCGHSWSKASSSKKDMYVCHICGKDNTMQDGGWLNKFEQGGMNLEQKDDNYGTKPNPNNVQASVGPDFVGLGYDTTGRNYSPAWGGQFEDGGNVAQGGKSIPTMADSLALYNTSKKVLDYYKDKKYKDYTNIDYKKKELYKRYNKEALAAFTKLNKTGGIKVPTDGGKKSEIKTIPEDSYYKKLDANRYLQRERFYGALDTKAPMQLFDNRITPTLQSFYANEKVDDPLYEDNVSIYSYDPILVKPVSMLTSKERALRLKRYGKASGLIDEKVKVSTSTEKSKIEPEKKKTEVVKKSEETKLIKPTKTEETKPAPYTPTGSKKYILNGMEVSEEDFLGSGNTTGGSKRIIYSTPKLKTQKVLRLDGTPETDPEKIRKAMRAQEKDDEFQSGGFLEPISYKLPSRYRIPYAEPSSELAMSIGGEEGEPAYLIPSFKGGKKLKDPIAEYKKTGEHLGGPFKTWQEADKWEQEIRHPYVEKGKPIPTPLKRWGDMAMGGSMPGAVGFTYARTAGSAPSNGKYAKKTKASAQNGKEMKYYQEGLDFKPNSIAQDGGQYFFMNLNDEFNTRMKNIDYVKGEYNKGMDFHNKWLNSPMYNSMINASDPINAKQITDQRKDRLSAVRFNYVDNPYKAGASTDQLGNIEVYPAGIGNKGVGVHEMSHVTDTGPGQNLIPAKDRIDISRYSLASENMPKYEANEEYFNYVTKPSETRARLNEIRQGASENKLYDPFTQKVNPAIYNKLKNFKFNSKPGDDPLQQLRSAYSDKQILEMLNSVSKNKDRQQQTTAQDGKEVTYTHQPGMLYDNFEPIGPGEKYMLKRTVTPYTSKRDIKKFTQAPTDPRQVNFLSNYAGATGEPLSKGFEYPTSVPYEGEKHWNIDRFIIDPQFETSEKLNTAESTKGEMKKNVLADMYKYFMLQNKGDRDDAWKQANKFVRQEINPRVKGEVYDEYLRKNLPIPNIMGITSLVDNSYLQKYNSVRDRTLSETTDDDDAFTELMQKNPLSKGKAFRVGMDWLMNYKGLSRKEAKKTLNKTKELPKFEQSDAEPMDMDPSKWKDGGAIVDPMGQWAHPGEVTIIPSTDITMEGVDYPVLGISDTGDQQMMYPGEDYQFDGDYVTEYPMMKEGGWLSKFDTAQSGGTFMDKVDADIAKLLGPNTDKNRSRGDMVSYFPEIRKAQQKPKNDKAIAQNEQKIKKQNLAKAVAEGNKNRATFKQDNRTSREKEIAQQEVVNAYLDEARGNSPFAQTFGSFTPTGNNEAAGQIAAEQFADNTPMMNAARLFTAARDLENNQLLKGADVATDLMQIGNFIPNPVGQLFGKIGNVSGGLVDTYQAYDAYDKGDYGDVAINLASVALPMTLGSSTFRRNSKYLQPGQPLNFLKGSERVNYIEPFKKVKGMTNKSLMTNRLLLGTLGAEAIYDSYQNGGWLGKFDTAQPGGTFMSKFMSNEDPTLNKNRGDMASYFPEIKRMQDKPEMDKAITKADQKRQQQILAQAVANARDKQATVKQDNRTSRQKEIAQQQLVNLTMNEAQTYSPLAQTFSSFTPTGDNPEAGKIFAKQFVDATPPMAMLRLMNAARDVKNNPYGIGQGNGFLANTLGTLGLVGDVLDVGVVTAPGVRAAGKYLTEQTPLRNASKFNPYALTDDILFNKEGVVNRQIFGDDAYNKFLEYGPTTRPNISQSDQMMDLVRAPKSDVISGSGEAFQVAKTMEDGAFKYPYFQEGSLWYTGQQRSNLAKELGKERIITTPTSDIWFAPAGESSVMLGDDVSQGLIDSYSKGRRVLMPGASEYAKPSKYSVFEPHWWKGYKEVTQPKLNWDTDIDWAKWNPEIPKNKKLMEEYIDIENSTKANNTWMKNPDGSEFKGSPEQFVQQQSQNFKKAFGNSKLVNPDGSPIMLYHGAPQKFNFFNPELFQRQDAGYSGVGIYTTPSKTTADSYAYSSRSSIGGKEHVPTVYELYGQANNPISAEELINEGGKRDLFNFNRQANWKGEIPVEERLTGYDAAIANTHPNVSRVRPWNEAYEIVFPKNTQLKSAIGNNGMFDMNNPNIYKALLPAVGVAGIAGASQKKNGGWLNKYK